MGLTIHYFAQIRDLDLLPQLEDEIEDICRSLEWPSRRVDAVVDVPSQYVPLEPGALNGSTPVHLKGISFTPPDSESVSLVFTKTGRLTTTFKMIVADSMFEVSPEFVYGAFTKTQFAGPDVHVAIVKLLKYLDKKYFADIQVEDEGRFWETMDREVLLQQFDSYNKALDSVAETLSNFKGGTPDSAAKLADQLEELLKKKLGGGE